jgi:shikimate 5-dehydrogenase
MNLNLPVLGSILGVILGGGGIAVAIINAWASKGTRKADITDKLSDSMDRALSRYDKDLARIEAKSDKCEVRLAVTERQLAESRDETRRIKTAFRVYMRAVQSKDPVAIETAENAAQELLV